MKNLNISEQMQKNLQDLGYSELTNIQKLAIPEIIKGNDLIAKAKTGSGKTAAFGVGVIERINIQEHGVQALILCPTRELAEQVSKEIRRLARAKANTKVLLLCGGHSFGYQLSSLKHEAHIIVGTPGRVLKHLNKGSLKLEKLKLLVLDEADRLLDMGFIEEIAEIISFTNKNRNTLLFSATFNDEIRDISHRFQKSPIEVEPEEMDQKPLIQQHFFNLNGEDKNRATLKALNHFKPESVIVFVNTKIEADTLASFLEKRGVDAKSIHGDLEQVERTDTLMQFANESISVLVATDVAARGLDIKDVNLVVNYDLPRSKENYIHRIGRVGRAGKEGIAISFTMHDSELIDELKDIYKEQINFNDISKLADSKNYTLKAKNRTLCILGGRKDKLRAGDILGALAKDGGFKGSDIGKIDISERDSYIAIDATIVDKVYKYLQNAKVKNRKFRVELLK